MIRHYTIQKKQWQNPAIQTFVSPSDAFSYSLIDNNLRLLDIYDDVLKRSEDLANHHTHLQKQKKELGNLHYLIQNEFQELQQRKNKFQEVRKMLLNHVNQVQPTLESSKNNNSNNKKVKAKHNDQLDHSQQHSQANSNARSASALQELLRKDLKNCYRNNKKRLQEALYNANESHSKIRKLDKKQHERNDRFSRRNRREIYAPSASSSSKVQRRRQHPIDGSVNGDDDDVSNSSEVQGWYDNEEYENEGEFDEPFNADYDDADNVENGVDVLVQ